jgi:uncharacterized protein (TIGR02270 family)
MNKPFLHLPIGWPARDISRIVNRRTIEQHAEEAGFLWSMRHRAVHAPHYDLADIAKLDEAVEAHLDGLRVARRAGWDQVMALAQDAPENIFPLAILAFGEGDRNRDRMHEAFNIGSANADTLSALISALGWLDRATVAPVLTALMTAQFPIYRRVGIAACAIHRHDPGRLLEKLIDDPDAQVRARALRAAGELKRLDRAAQAVAHLGDPDEACRFWAVWTSCLLNLPNVLDALHPYLFDTDSPFNLHALHMGLRAVRSAPQSVWFDELCHTPGLERQAVMGAGIAGNPAVMPWLLEQMQQPALAKFAGEAFSMMTGIDLYYYDLNLKGKDDTSEKTNGSNYKNLEEIPWSDDAEEIPDPDEEIDLPVPDPYLIAAWWQRHQHKYAIGYRYLAGEIISPATAMNILRHGLQRQRKAAALELALLQPEQPLFEVRAQGKKQERMLNP